MHLVQTNILAMHRQAYCHTAMHSKQAAMHQ